MTERKLATIRRIEKIEPIPDADRIEKLTLDGWHVVSQKGIHKEGDLVVYLEVDSWVPQTVAPFLCEHEKNPREYNGVPGARLKTMKLRGQISQGLVLPLAEVIDIKDLNFPETCEGQDVTETLGIQLWEKPIPAQLSGLVKRYYPPFFPKTDQERIQNLKKYLEHWIYEGGLWEVTEKLDGSSMSVYLYMDETGAEDFGVCSRNIDLKESEDNSFWQVTHQLGLYDKLKALGHYVIQGELVGPGVQKNIYNLPTRTMFVFDIYDIDKAEYVLPSERSKICDDLDLVTVPVLGIEPLSKDINWFLEHAEGVSQLNPTVDREGVVWRLLDPDLPRRSFKAISNKYLLKHGDE